MKKYILSISLFVGLASLHFSCNLTGRKKEATANADTLIDKANAPIIQFVEESFDFGKLKEGDVVEHKFRFKNVGKSPLQIHDVVVQCGCTVAKKPEKPVGVGQESEIVVSFNSEHKAGINKKFVRVYSNANPPQSTLSFTAEVASKAINSPEVIEKSKKINKL
jgi:hypothetical protein